MPTITLSKKELLKTVGKLSDKELKYRISMLGTDLEGIEGDAISVEIFPNRPDLLSQQGFARALASFIGKKTGLRKYHVKKSGEQVIIDKSVATCRPCTSCAIIKGLKIDDEKLREIIDIQEKLHITFGRNRKRVAIGIYPMEHLTFPITFKGLKLKEIEFTPLEMKQTMRGDEILTDHPKGAEYAHLVQGLDKVACFLDAKGNYMSMTPIINSEFTGKITQKTKDVFVECSGFDQRILDEAINMIVTALADMGATIHSLELRYPNRTITTPNLAPTAMKLDADYINRIIGFGQSEKAIVSLLAKMGYGYDGKVLVPAYRTDVMHQADLAEDAAIAYGYDNVEEKIPDVSTIGQADPFNSFCTVVRDVLVSHGLLEAHNYNLIGKEAQTAKMNVELDVIGVKHSVSEEFNTLRAWLFPSLLETLERNKKHDYPQEFFEIGKTFRKENGVTEETCVAVALCGEDADYTRIRQVLDSLFAALGITGKYTASTYGCFIPGRVAKVKVGKEDVAYVGEIAPEVLKNFNLEMPVAVFGLNLSTLRRAYTF